MFVDNVIIPDDAETTFSQYPVPGLGLFPSNVTVPSHVVNGVLAVAVTLLFVIVTTSLALQLFFVTVQVNCVGLLSKFVTGLLN